VIKKIKKVSKRANLHPDNTLVALWDRPGADRNCRISAGKPAGTEGPSSFLPPIVVVLTITSLPRIEIPGTGLQQLQPSTAGNCDNERSLPIRAAAALEGWEKPCHFPTRQWG